MYFSILILERVSMTYIYVFVRSLGNYFTIADQRERLFDEVYFIGFLVANQAPLTLHEFPSIERLLYIYKDFIA